ncbi:methyltransferase domain-containing protein [Hydrogenophilus thermoluteolus]|uniref:Malonyl-CoA O-methyltransferase n=1 Tax=Hydrogenophilus thermoluteolus TaxID=297 RepID=A0A2Z6DYH6_HYDTE|nr:methyltransferase domain-containing protein [Hydrogenophilus thermoluteolus]BBD77571.1 malonyl-CoA O-methyltransferase [Hydrogenophilus thermoluteolus]
MAKRAQMPPSAATREPPAAPKARVRAAFGRRASHTAHHDVAQRKIAATLFAALDAAIAAAEAPLPQTPWLLDAGCGVGRDLPHLKARFPHHRLLALDAAPALLATLPPELATPIVGDLEQLPFPTQTLALYWSNCAWQWTTPALVVGELARTLAPNGWAALSIVLAGTFPELAAAFSELDEPAPLAPLADESTWRQAFACHPWRTLHGTHHTIPLFFATPQELLASIRGVGATATPKTPHRFDRTRPRRLAAALERLRGPHGIPLTYQILTILAQRP